MPPKVGQRARPGDVGKKAPPAPKGTAVQSELVPTALPDEGPRLSSAVTPGPKATSGPPRAADQKGL